MASTVCRVSFWCPPRMSPPCCSFLSPICFRRPCLLGFRVNRGKLWIEKAKFRKEKEEKDKQRPERKDAEKGKTRDIERRGRGEEAEEGYLGYREKGAWRRSGERERERERERRGKERRMVFNSRWVATVATLSADACQYVACNPERLSSEQVLDLVCWLPLHHLRRLAICLFSFFCFPVAVPPPNSPFYAYHRSFSASSSSSSSSSEDYDSAGYDSHSD